MVSLYVLSPAHKLRFLSKLILKGSKRILKEISISSSSSSSFTPPSSEEQPTPKRSHSRTDVFELIKPSSSRTPTEGLTHDALYYKADYEGGLCVFLVANTLFRVHKCYLLREPSAFGDMFTLPFIGSDPSDTSPIPLYDTAENFRDLLWALYALPTELASTAAEDSPPIERLLNVAELANKYCMVSYETWALKRILTLAQNPFGFLRSAPSELCARALNIAVLSDHHELLDMVTQRLVARILWTDVDRRPILQVAESRGLRKIQGVAYYKELITLEKASGYDGTGDGSTIFPPSISVEQRTRFLAAHHSLTNLCEYVRTNPPTFMDSGCTSHGDCLTTWSEMWLSAGVASQTARHGPADVLGRLKTMMILLKKWMQQSPITIDCTLAALESITTARDDIISDLMDHFQGY